MSGKHLSPVQEFALNLVVVGEARSEKKESTEAFKRAILTADPGRYIPLLYPELNANKVDAQEIGDEEMMQGSGEWEFPEAMSPVDAEEVMAQMLRHPGGSMGLSEVERFMQDED